MGEDLLKHSESLSSRLLMIFPRKNKNRDEGEVMRVNDKSKERGVRGCEGESNDELLILFDER